MHYIKCDEHLMGYLMCNSECVSRYMYRYWKKIMTYYRDINLSDIAQPNRHTYVPSTITYNIELLISGIIF